MQFGRVDAADRGGYSSSHLAPRAVRGRVAVLRLPHCLGRGMRQWRVWRPQAASDIVRFTVAKLVPGLAESLDAGWRPEDIDPVRLRYNFRLAL